MDESKIFGISWRGILALVVIVTVCVLSYFKIKVEEPLYSLVLVISSAYFGSKGINGNGKKEEQK